MDIIFRETEKQKFHNENENLARTNTFGCTTWFREEHNYCWKFFSQNTTLTDWTFFFSKFTIPAEINFIRLLAKLWQNCDVILIRKFQRHVFVHKLKGFESIRWKDTEFYQSLKWLTLFSQPNGQSDTFWWETILISPYFWGYK